MQQFAAAQCRHLVDKSEQLVVFFSSKREKDVKKT